MSDTTDFSSRVNEISEQLQSAVGEAIERWARDGRNQLRSAVGAPDQSAIMGAFVLGAAIGALAETGSGESERVARTVASAPIDFREGLAAAVRGDDAAVEAAAFRTSLALDPFRTLLQLAVQPALWTASEQCRSLTDLARWSRGYCPVCGAWPLYGELVGPQRERQLRCGRCGAAWAWGILLCPYCGENDHRRLSKLENPEERESRRVDLCERCHGYVKAIASFTPVPAPQIAAEDVATLHLDLAARERGYQRPGRVLDPASARSN